MEATTPFGSEKVNEHSGVQTVPSNGRREDAERLAVDVIVVHTAGELLGKAIQKDIVDELVEKVAVQLGLSAAEIWRKQFMELVDGSEGK